VRKLGKPQTLPTEPNLPALAPDRATGHLALARFQVSGYPVNRESAHRLIDKNRISQPDSSLIIGKKMQSGLQRCAQTIVCLVQPELLYTLPLQPFNF
jgi:hypothetical protein